MKKDKWEGTCLGSHWEVVPRNNSWLCSPYGVPRDGEGLVSFKEGRCFVASLPPHLLSSVAQASLTRVFLGLAQLTFISERAF